MSSIQQVTRTTWLAVALVLIASIVPAGVTNSEIKVQLDGGSFTELRGALVLGGKITAPAKGPAIAVTQALPLPRSTDVGSVIAVAARWKVSDGSVAFRVRQPDSMWLALTGDHDNDQVDATQFSGLTFLSGDAEYVQVEITLSPSATLSSLTLTIIDPGASPTPQRTFKGDGQDFTKPSVTSRTDWGCPDGQTSPWLPSYTTVTHLIVHHTDTPNVSSDWPGVVRSIWSYHKYTRGWGDIGYNYLVDPTGVVYEGRAGGDNVIGAHFRCMNSATMGVAAIGVYSSELPTATAQDKLASLLAWKSEQRGFGPFDFALHSPSALNLQRVSGHRDANPSTQAPPECKTTVCPGDRLYGYLPQVRQAVADKLRGTGGGTTAVAGDWNNDGLDVIWTFNNGVWTVPLEDGGPAPFAMGLAGDLPLVGDFNGDGLDDYGIMRVTDNPTRFYLDLNRDAIADMLLELPGYFPQDLPVAGDWDGDGDDDVGAWDTGTGFYYRSTISGSTLIPYDSFQMGNPGDLPIAGDWDGDGAHEVGVFRPGDPNADTNNFYFRRADTSVVALTSYAEFANGWGNRGDVPAMGDWDGDGDTNIGLYRDSDQSPHTSVTAPELGADNALLLVTSPNGGETWTAGENRQITWNASGLNPAGRILIYYFNGVEWLSVAGVDVSSRSYTWTVPNTPTNSAEMFVGNWLGDHWEVYDESDGPFTIIGGGGGTPTVQLISPNGGETWTAGEQHLITWTADNLDPAGHFFLFYSNGVTWTQVTDLPLSARSYNWTVPNEPTDNASFFVGTWLGDDWEVYDFADAPFTIVGSSSSPTVQLISPNGGETWAAGEQHVITWTADDLDAAGHFFLFYSNGVTWTQVTDLPLSARSYNWTVPNDPTDNASFFVGTWLGDDWEVYDFADAPFTIVGSGSSPTVQLISPNGGETWTAGEQRVITWTADNLDPAGHFFLFYSNGVTWTQVTDLPLSARSYNWTVPNDPTDNASFFVGTWLGDDWEVYDFADAPFTIVGSGSSPTVQLISPNGGETWTAGEQHVITWTADNLDPAGHFFLFYSNGVTWTQVTDLPLSARSYNWTVPNDPTDNASFFVGTWLGDDWEVYDFADAPFTISDEGNAPFMRLSSPNGGETWTAGEQRTITWEASGLDPSGWLHLFYTTDGVDWISITDLPLSSRSYTWTVPYDPTSTATIWVGSWLVDTWEVYDVNDSPFTLR